MPFARHSQLLMRPQDIECEPFNSLRRTQSLRALDVARKEHPDLPYRWLTESVISFEHPDEARVRAFHAQLDVPAILILDGDTQDTCCVVGLARHNMDRLTYRGVQLAHYDAADEEE